MSYTIHIYAPDDSVSAFSVNGGVVYAAGTSTPCYERSGLTSSSVTSIVFNQYSYYDGYSFYRWVINEGGSVRYSYTENLSYSYSGTATDVFLRVETQQEQVYYATVEFDANGGSGAPSSVSGESDTQTVTITLPMGEPTWTNHIFVGWALDPDASSAEYSPGGTYPFYGNATGYTHTLYAVWAEDAGGAYISTGGALNQASVYIYNGGWLKVTPYIYNGGWRKCT